jgi:hypothetical protein
LNQSQFNAFGTGARHNESQAIFTFSGGVFVYRMRAVELPTGFEIEPNAIAY